MIAQVTCGRETSSDRPPPGGNPISRSLIRPARHSILILCSMFRVPMFHSQASHQKGPGPVALRNTKQHAHLPSQAQAPGLRVLRARGVGALTQKWGHSGGSISGQWAVLRLQLKGGVAPALFGDLLPDQVATPLNYWRQWS